MIDPRFMRTEMLLGKDNMQKLQTSKIAIFGIGGVGSYAVEALARTGIGSIVLVDNDVVDITNINRQVHALENSIGISKVSAMSQRIRLINPDIEIAEIQAFVTADNCAELVTDDLNFVVDAVDTVTAKVALMKICIEKGIPIVSAMGAGNKIDPTKFEIADISKTHTCPLARAVRKKLRSEGITQGVKVVYSPVEPMVPATWKERQENDVAASETRKEKFPPGSIAFVPSVAGLIIASVVIRDLISG